MNQSSAIEEGSQDAAIEVIIFHGYTGSPDGFRTLAARIAQELHAHVTVPLLPGHGTTINDLQQVPFDDFISFAREKLSTVSSSRKPFIIIGYCFGGYLATLLSAEFKPAQLVIALTPYSPRFPLNIPGIASLLKMRSTWSKFLYKEEKDMRKGLFYYPRVPGRSQELVNDGIQRIQRVMSGLSMPILTIHTTDDPTCVPQSGSQMLAISGKNPNNESRILPHRRHNLFFGPHAAEDIEIVISFLKKNL